MQEIRLTKGYKTQVNDEDVLHLLQWEWHAHISNGVVYAARCYKIKKKGFIVYMHRYIYSERMGLIIPEDKLIDHKDIYSLNNQRDNLRLADLSINGHNSKLQIRNTSGIRGVRLNKDGMWTARIHLHGKDIWLGTFITEKMAEEARKLAEEKYNPKAL